MILIGLGLTLGMFTTLSMWGGTSADLVIFLFGVAASCVLGGAARLGSMPVIAWSLTVAAAFLGLWLHAASTPDDGTQGIGLLVAGFAFLGLASLVVAVTSSVRLWLLSARHRAGQPRRPAETGN